MFVLKTRQSHTSALHIYRLGPTERAVMQCFVQKHARRHACFCTDTRRHAFGMGDLLKQSDTHIQTHTRTHTHTCSAHATNAYTDTL